MFHEIQPKTYQVKLDNPNSKPPKSFRDAQGRERQWFEAFNKEKDGMLRLQTWIRFPQNQVTPDMRRLALRAHHIFNVKRDGSAKVRVVVNGKRQHESTFSDTTSPVIPQFQFRTFLAHTALRKYYMVQMDLTNAYLHADIVDKVYIVIPQGFPGEGEIAKLDKATYGTKQGARRFYDHTVKVLNTIGFEQCPNEPCLFRYLTTKDAAFLILYVDDALISGTQPIVEEIQRKLKQHFDVKFSKPKDFIGLDIDHKEDGTITLSMHTFTTKMKETFNITNAAPILTPGRTDKKIIRGLDPEPDANCRSKVGSLMWTTMGTRFDITYAVKELSRVLQEPTAIAGEILERTLDYVTQTKEAFLQYAPETMLNYQIPATRQIPHAQQDIYDTQEYIHQDDIPHHDDKPTLHKYIFQGPQIITTCYTDIDLAGQHETRQSTSGYLLYLNGALVHWHGRTERLIIKSTAAGEYIALSRGHAACQFMTTILQFYGNTKTTAYLFTDNQAAEHIATKPTMNEHSRSIDIRHHAVRQDYLKGNIQIKGVKTTENPSDILTKFLPAPTHMKHASPLNISFPTNPTDSQPKPTSMTTHTTTYTQNGNSLYTPHNHTHKTRQPTYRRTSALLATRRPHTLSRPVNVITTRRPQLGRARVRLNKTTVDVLRQRPAIPSSYKQHQFINEKPRTKKPTLTPAKRSPGPKLAGATTGHQAIHRQRPHMRTLQHITPQAHHAPKHASNLHPRNTYRQHCKPPPRHLYQPLQDHQVRMVSIDHSLLENHQRQHTTRTRTTRAHTHATFTKQQEQRVNKWMSTLWTPPPPTQTSTKPNHPFAFNQNTQPTATATHTQCKCMTNLTRGQIRQTGNKNPETKNKYNFSQTSPKRRRKRTSCSKHIDKSNKQTRTSQFHMKPIDKRNPANTITWTPSKQDEIDKKAKQKQKIKSTNENLRITPVLQIHPQTNQKVFQVKYRTKFTPNQKEPTHRNNLISSNEKATKIANRNDLYKNKKNAFTEIAGDNVLIVKRVDTRRRRLRSRRCHRVTRGDGQLSTSVLPTGEKQTKDSIDQ